MSNGYIIIDDQDAQLNYTGQWSVSGAGMDYDQSVHASNVSASSMAFRFTGTSVSLIGTFDAGGSCSVAVSLDGEQHKFDSPTVTTTSHQQTIWSSTRLADTNHTLLYSIESCSGNSTSDPYLWFDYILYEPSSDVPSGAKYFIDDTSGQVEWNGQWTQKGEDGDFNSTRHVLQKDASLRLKFTGSKASVYGRVDSNVSTQAAFSLDGGGAEIFNAPSSGVVQHNVQFFSSNTLDQTEHTLVMTAQSDALSIDYFIVRSNPAVKTDPAVADGHSGPSTSIIIGAAAGGVVLLVVLAVAFWFFRRKRKAPTSKATSKAEDTGSFCTPSYPPTPSGATFHYSTEDIDLGPPTTYSSSARHSTSQRHARMRSVHQHHSDEDVISSDPRREHHMSVGASSSASSGQYTESDVYAVYDDPFHVPPPTVSHYPSVSSKTSLLRGQKTDSLPSEFGASVPRRKSKMQSVVTSSEDQSELSYDLPSPPGYATRFPTSRSGGSHMSSSDLSTTSRQTVLHALDPSEEYFPPLSDLKKRTLSTDLRNFNLNEYNDCFLPPTRYGNSKINPGKVSFLSCLDSRLMIRSYSFLFIRTPNPAFASSSHRHLSTSSSGSSRPLPDPRNYQASDDGDGRSLSERDVKRPGGLVVLSVDGLSTSGSMRRAPVVHRDSGFRMYTPEPSEGHSSHSHSHMEEDMDELPPVYTPR
ncbi:hypothetical protein BDZ89DRAFT_1126991 [Hymenopellis radicata]|nr:hypothetical protein BDZ89DRAFT_1126991 [Hymenopellis radicata]